MTRNNWIAHNITFLYQDAIVNAVVETKLGKGWDIVICLASGINISLVSQLPPDWVFIPFCGGNYFYSIPYEEKFRIFPEKKIITYDDLTREKGIELLLKTISMVEEN